MRTPSGRIVVTSLAGCILLCLVAAGANAAAASAAAASAAAGGPPSREHPLAISGATIHRVNGPDLAGGTVLIGTDGKIADMGAADRVPVPADAERVDATGLHLYPGWINANTVLGLVEIGAVRATNDVAEVGALNPGARAEVAINPSSELIPVTRANGVLVALTAGRGGMIAGTSALIALDGWTWEEMTIKAPVAMHVQWPGMGLDRRPEAKQKIEEQIEAREMQIRALTDAFAQAAAYWQAERAAGEMDVPRHDEDVAWAAMRPVIERKIPVVIQADDIAQIHAALEWTAAQGIDMILAGGKDAWRVAPELARRKIPVILNGVNDLPARNYEPYDTPYANAGRLHAAGVTVLFSTGPGSFGAANARNLPYETAKAVAFGLPREAAIRALTLDAARVFGVADRLGSIERGKDATLILVAGDPLEATGQVRRAWIAGRDVDLENRHQRLYEKYSARPRPAGGSAPAR
jgi:imidazolonepropionase-like amidohydrolase